MESKIGHKYRVRWFYAASVVTLVAIFLLRFVLLPKLMGPHALSPWETTGKILDAFLTALIASVVITLLREWLTPEYMQSAAIEVIEPFRIAETLRLALEKTDEWWYRGHSGRHFRAVTLPKLAEDARARSITIAIRLQILDPTDDATCARYANYRLSLASATEGAPWTKQRARNELIATILSAYAWKAEIPRLDFKIALFDNLSLFRIDLSSRLALITKEAKQEPALKCDEESIFYTSFRQDLVLGFEQAKALPDNVACVPLRDLTLEHVRRFINDVGFGNLNMDDSVLREITAIAKTAKNPYA
jgi:hypothetical protein